MNEKNKKFEILKQVTIIYTDGIKENFEAIRKIDKGVIIGRIIDDEFVDCGFISKRNIKEIKKW
jgi:hypothetical protein